MIDQIITQIASTMNVSEAYVRAAIDRIIDAPQPYAPICGIGGKEKKCNG